MQVRVFESHDIASTLKKVKESLGPDALILSTRTIRGKGLGMLAKSTVEVTAAIDNDPPPGSWLALKKKRPPPPVPARAYDSKGQGLTYEELEQETEPLPPMEKVEIRTNRNPADLRFLHGEIKELKKLVENLLNEKTAFEAQLEDAGRKQSNEEARLAPVRKALSGYGINDLAAELILRAAGEDTETEQFEPPDRLTAFLRKTMNAMSRVSEPIRPLAGSQKRVALIGPTGVGKTTTIAKLAAHHLQNHGNSIALVTVDTYRIAAVEQLKIYGEIMKLPVEVVMKPAQLRRMFEKHADKELVLIDTAGRSPRDLESLEELTSFFNPAFGIENHLVLSANTAANDLDEAVRRFSCLPLHSLIFTKLDESVQLGTLLNIPTRHSYPVSYLTNGQKVPEDILFPTREMIADIIMKGAG